MFTLLMSAQNVEVFTEFERLCAQEFATRFDDALRDA